MKTRLSVIAVLTLSSQLAFADPATEAADSASQANDNTTQQVEATASDSQIKALERDLTPSLQSKLDALMDFDAQPAPYPRSKQEVASAH